MPRSHMHNQRLQRQLFFCRPFTKHNFFRLSFRVMLIGAIELKVTEVEKNLLFFAVDSVLYSRYVDL